MSNSSDKYLKDIPMVPYDLLKEGAVMFGIVAIVIIILASIFSSPQYPPVTSQQMGYAQPLATMQMTASVLIGQCETQTYGPPYNKNGKPQEIFGIAPANWFGVSIPIDVKEAFVLKPLSAVAIMNEEIRLALDTYNKASTEQQMEWGNNYNKMISKAKYEKGEIINLKDGNFGPVPVMVNGILMLSKSGLLESAQNMTPWSPFVFNFTNSLLFIQNSGLNTVATTLDMQGTNMGISHETGPWPGAWWLWLYSSLYQIPPMLTSNNGDIQVGSIMLIVFLILLFLPFIPIINKIPYWIPLYKIFWRDWYKDQRNNKSKSNN